jgi:hypothetical protein
MSAISELLREIPLPQTRRARPEVCPHVEEAVPSTALIPFSQRDEQIQALAHNLFFRSELGMVRHVGFAPVEPSQATAKLCLDLATFLSADGKYDVGLIEAGGGEFTLGAQINGPIPADLSTPWTIAPRLWMAAAESWGSHPGRHPVTGQSILHFRDLVAKFHFSIVCCPPVSGLSMRLARCCDGLVLVLTANRTRRLVAAQIRDGLKKAAIPVFGAVLAERRFPVPDRLYHRL